MKIYTIKNMSLQFDGDGFSSRDGILNYIAAINSALRSEFDRQPQLFIDHNFTLEVRDDGVLSASTTVSMAKERGANAGLLDAARFDKDPENFECADNPYGMDTEPDLNQAWQDEYENAFEGAKGRP